MVYAAAVCLFGAQVACPAADAEFDLTSGVQPRWQQRCRRRDGRKSYVYLQRGASLLAPLLAMPVQDHPEHDLPVAKVLHGIICHSMGSRFTCKSWAH